VLINGAYPLLGHAALALDGGFLRALLMDWRFTGLLLFNFCWLSMLAVARNRVAWASPSLQLHRALLAVFVLFVVATGLVTPGISAHWYAQNVVEHQFRWGERGFATDMAVRDGRSLVPSADGEPLQPIAVPRHVVLLLIEGLGAAMVTSGEMPEIHALESEGLVARRFITHQRQTHRGFFSVLRGAYPNFLVSEAKSHLVSLSGLQQRCLPAALRDAGFRTAFLQAFDMGYMTKDLFAQAPGSR